MENIHAHEVMQMIVDTGNTYTRESLVAAIHERFGAEGRFHTCSAENLTADDLVTFLEAKGKVFRFQRRHGDES